MIYILKQCVGTNEINNSWELNCNAVNIQISPVNLGVDETADLNHVESIGEKCDFHLVE